MLMLCLEDLIAMKTYWALFITLFIFTLLCDTFAPLNHNKEQKVTIDDQINAAIFKLHIC